MNNKGQEAQEFLEDYGWAILVATIAIGILAYFGVFAPGKFAPEGVNDKTIEELLNEVDSDEELAQSLHWNNKSYFIFRAVPYCGLENKLEFSWKCVETGGNE